MRAEMQAVSSDIRKSLELLRRSLDWDTAQRRLDELNARAEDPALWNDSRAAQIVMRERNRLDAAVSGYLALEKDFNDSVELLELAEAENDEAMVADAESSLKALKARAGEEELKSLLSGEADANDTYLEINAGAGGTESQDWAQMLLRMYTRWAARRGFKTELVAESEGEQAGIKSATLLIKGEYAYGWAKTESGVHRLVRISPFDSNARRHTSFCSVWVYPVIDDNIEIDVSEKDVRIDVYRASGAGGQHVNKTESAVRIVHLATGITVACQSERSQHKNKDQAWKMLRARLYEAELKKREALADAQNATKTDIGWGHQIRSYVLQPYQLVKDLRTGVESYSPSDVLDGDLDPFMAAALAQKIKGTDAIEVKDLD
ncbi:MAG: peptide chain release factor 2 [Alphaproteobacteria bacterium]